jgi:hypothetical protein
LPAFGLIHQSKSETQGLLSQRGGAIRARLGLLFLGLAGHMLFFKFVSFLLYCNSSILGDLYRQFAPYPLGYTIRFEVLSIFIREFLIFLDAFSHATSSPRRFFARSIVQAPSILFIWLHCATFCNVLHGVERARNLKHIRNLWGRKRPWIPGFGTSDCETFQILISNTNFSKRIKKILKVLSSGN